MFSKIKKLFSFQSEFQRFLVKSSLIKDNYVLKQDDIETLITYFQDQHNIDEFFMFFLEGDSHIIKMKLLICCQYLLTVCDDFAQVFLRINFQSFVRSKYLKADNEVWLLENIQLPMLQYLQKVAHSIEEIKSYRNHHFRKQVIQNSLVLDCFKLENLVNHGLSLVPHLKTALQNFPHDFLLKKLTCTLYSEVRMFQKQLINSLSALLDQKSHATNIEIYEFFREVQQIEKKTMQFYLLHKLFDPARKLMPPLQLKIDIKSAKHLEQQAHHEQQRLMAQKVQKSQRLTRASSVDFTQRVQQGFISQREKKFQFHSKAKNQATIQEELELPTEIEQSAPRPRSKLQKAASQMNSSSEGSMDQTDEVAQINQLN